MTSGGWARPHKKKILRHYGFQVTDSNSLLYVSTPHVVHRSLIVPNPGWEPTTQEFFFFADPLDPHLFQRYHTFDPTGDGG